MDAIARELNTTKNGIEGKISRFLRLIGAANQFELLAMLLEMGFIEQRELFIRPVLPSETY